MKEIERRWIIHSFNKDILDDPSKVIREISQGYLNSCGQLRVRINEKIGGSVKCELTYKKGQGLSREERNERISLGAAFMLMDTTSRQVAKTRYEIGPWEIDIFKGPLEGLILLEREMESEDETFDLPDWVYKATEVTETVTNQQVSRVADLLTRMSLAGVAFDLGDTSWLDLIQRVNRKK